MLRSPTAPRATLQKETSLMVILTLGQFLLLFSEQTGESAPLLIRVKTPPEHRNPRLFKD